MQKIMISVGLLLFIAITLYANDKFGLLSMAGLNGKGLSTKEVKGDLKSSSDLTTVNVDHCVWSRLLQKYVDNKGLVDYNGFLNEKQELEEYLKTLSKQVPADDWSIQEQLAYYINAYNAYTVYLILENYPVQSIKDIKGAWTKDIVRIGNKEISLGALEHSILRKMNEPRIHFAINCASGSCPKLLNEAFNADDLDEQLNKVTYAFINSRNNTISKDHVELSKIFKWYKSDFFNGDLVAYINQYSKESIPAGAKIKYKEYNWNLNGR